MVARVLEKVYEFNPKPFSAPRGAVASFKLLSAEFFEFTAQMFYSKSPTSIN